MIVALLAIIALLSIPASLGLLVVFHLFRPKKSPANKTNRINHIRLFWFALTREGKFVEVFPWMKEDERDNLK